MPLLLLAFVFLILLLTGALLPALVAGGWILVVIIGGLLLIGVAAAVIRPVLELLFGVAQIGSGYRKWFSLPGDGDRVAARQRPADSGPAYLAWANREGDDAGEFKARRSGVEARRGILVKRRDALRRRLGL